MKDHLRRAPAPDLCLDPTPAAVIEVPTEMSLAEALATAKSFELIQVRGEAVGAATVPANVSLRGCKGASITGDVGFLGGVQDVQGFMVTGRLYVNRNGTLNIIGNRFSRPFTAQDTLPGVGISTFSAPLGVETDINVRDCTFIGRSRGIELSADTNSGVKGMNLNVTNTVFSNVDKPIVFTRTSTSVTASAAIVSSTFYDFGPAILLNGASTGLETVTVDASLFVLGQVGIDASNGGGKYRLAYSFHDQLKTPTTTPGNIVTPFDAVDPKFVAAGEHDFRLARGSMLVNRIPGVVIGRVRISSSVNTFTDDPFDRCRCA